MAQILFTVFGMGYIYENAQIIDNHGTLLHTTVAGTIVGTCALSRTKNGNALGARQKNISRTLRYGRAQN